MPELITGLSVQREFPRVDLTEDNADLLELMMANVHMLDQAHTAAEESSWVFRIGHRAIITGANRRTQQTSPHALAAVNNGVATFEAIASIIQGMSVNADMAQANREFLKLMQADDHDLDRYIDASLDSFTADMPRTAEVVRASTRRFHGPLTSYAVLGAAMARKFDLDSLEVAA